jgi:holo-[acyl-carrier protein] synthase
MQTTTSSTSSALASALRVGTDLVEIATVAESVRRFGDRYLQRLYTVAELNYCHESPPQFAPRLAARFAAKEAVLKVLRPEGAWPAWCNIEVVRHAHGWCEIRLHGEAALLAARNNMSIVSCSLSHEGSYASAVVLGLAHG